MQFRRSMKLMNRWHPNEIREKQPVNFSSAWRELTNYRGFQIHEDSTRYVFPSTSLTEESVEGIVSTSNGLVTGHLSVGLNSMLQAIQLPTGVTDLTTSLSDVDGDALTLNT